ncbi:hypothetical protein [Roseateles albus]|uniref:Uncharacterized protein n=1 Tax=Roseateles albus TaxID=2987525 RepID=A0ABT5KAG4_9BURK|nr:hypothetical protein [Roseateles albus]MDC8770936.1 hypothetical protein [Roseateles albus]
MSDASLLAEIEFALPSTVLNVDVGTAAISDLLRALHEVMTKSGRDQANLMAQVQTVFGSTAMHHLALVLEAETENLTTYRLANDCPLYSKVEAICRERGFTKDAGFQFFKHFFKALDEERKDSDGNIESATTLTYWSLGGEAAYHLGGLYTGDLLDVVSTALCGYLDSRLNRFQKLVEMWKMELAWDKEDAE